MVILELYQNDYSKDLVAFDSIEDGKAFVAQIPGYTLETEDGLKWSILILNTCPIIWKLSSMGILSLYLGFRLILRKMWTLLERDFESVP